MEETTGRVELFCRSSSETQMRMMESMFASIARLAGAALSPMRNYYPAWQPDPATPTVEMVKVRTICYLADHLWLVFRGRRLGSSDVM